MTDELVERVDNPLLGSVANKIEAILSSRLFDRRLNGYTLEASNELARAAIAECEGSLAVTYTIKALEELARVQAELADEKMLRETQESALNQCCNRRALLEAEAAAMRTALNETLAEAREHRKNIIEAREIGFHDIDEEKYQPAFAREISRFDALIDRAANSLSPEAGEKVLDVVRAAQAWAALSGAGRRAVETTTLVDAEREIYKALSALGEMT